MAQTAKYRFTADVRIPCGPPLEPGAASVLTRESIKLPDADDLSITIVRAQDQHFDLLLEWTVELPFNQQYYTPDWEPPESLLFLPGENGGPTLVAIEPIIAHTLVLPMVVRIAAATGRADLLRAFDDTPYDQLLPRIEVEVEGHRRTLRTLAEKGGRVAPPPRRFSGQELIETVLRPTELWEYFLAASDENYAQMDNYGTLANLVTALEVAAYKFLCPSGRRA
jgi:hypothetical protein